MTSERAMERRLVTCVFIDVIGSTDLTRRLGPERMRRLLDDAFAEISAKAAAEGGTVEKYIGDEVFILFGAPVAHSDDAARALRVAEACVDWSRESGTPLAVRVGVETGEALVDLASLDLRQRMAVGECVNIAARLQQHATVGDILVGPTCRAAVDLAAEFADVGELELKGLGRVRASRFVRSRAAPSRVSPFVGRSSDLDRLRTAYERMARGNATFVLVSGEPGIGKTRLVDEFVAALPQPASVLRARCRPGMEVGAKTPLRELVGDADPADLPPPIGHAIGVITDTRLLALSALDRQNEIATAWREYFTQLAHERPLVVCIEDVHWAETETVRVLDRASFRNDVPLMIVATARPDFPALTAVRPGEDRMFLDLAPLDLAEAVALARSFGAQDVSRIERAAGNPLFIVELFRARPTPVAEVPLTLQAAIAARLDELPQPERDLLQRVSIVGDHFTVRDAAVVSDRLPAEVAAMLGRLVHLQYIEPAARGFRFHHVLLRDAAYSRLPAQSRLRLHATYASVGLDPDDVEALAHHWWEAVGSGDAEWVWTPAEREELRVEARRAHLAAGQRLGDRLAAERMVVTFERALQLSDGGVESAEVEEAFGLAYARNASGEDATVHRMRAIELLRSSGQAVPAKLYADTLDLPVNNWGYFKRMPSFEELLGLIDDGIAAARASADQVSLMRLLVHRAFFANDRQVIPEIDEIAASAGDRRPFADAYWRLALLYAVELHDVAKAKTALDLSLELAAQGTRINEPEAVLWQCLVEFHSGDLAAAERLADRLATLAATMSPHTQQHGLGAKSLVALARGRWADIAAHADRLRALADANPTASFCIWGANLLGYSGIADVMEGRALRDDLESFAARLLPEAPSTRAAALLPAFAIAGWPVRYDDATRSYESRTRIADRQGVFDLGGMNVVLADVARERWDAVERWLPRLDMLAAGGARFSGALAAAVREEIAHARGGPRPGHKGLRDLGYVGFSELLSRRALPTAAAPARPL